MNGAIQTITARSDGDLLVGGVHEGRHYACGRIRALEWRRVAESSLGEPAVGHALNTHFQPEGIVIYDYAAFGWICDPVEELKKG